jgi:hypothetical protein
MDTKEQITNKAGKDEKNQVRDQIDLCLNSCGSKKQKGEVGVFLERVGNVS